MSYKILFVILLGLFLNGCATSPGISTTLTSYELSINVKKSPVVKITEKLSKVRGKEEIEIHYFNFHFMNSPDRINNWQHYYKIGEHTEPKWSYREIGKIEFWVLDRNDQKNIDVIKNEASNYGADAVVDLFRKPINISKQNAPPASPYSLIDSRIGGYLYFGKLVKRK